jgi:hypothetical protein
MNHFPQLVNPDVFNDTIKAFVSKTARTGETVEGNGQGAE